MPKISLAQAQVAKKEVRRRFRQLSSVTGIGITRVSGGYAIKLNVSVRDPNVVFPTNIGGVPLRVEVTGSLKAR